MKINSVLEMAPTVRRGGFWEFSGWRPADITEAEGLWQLRCESLTQSPRPTPPSDLRSELVLFFNMLSFIDLVCPYVYFVQNTNVFTNRQYNKPKKRAVLDAFNPKESKGK